MSDFTRFQDLIPRALKKYKMSREARAAQVCQRFRELAPDMIGKEALEHVRPRFFKGGTLYIGVPDSVWAQKVYVHRHDLLMKLNLDMEATTGKACVDDLRTLVEDAGGSAANADYF
jgi:hypothetical protein